MLIRAFYNILIFRRSTLELDRIDYFSFTDWRDMHYELTQFVVTLQIVVITK